MQGGVGRDQPLDVARRRARRRPPGWSSPEPLDVLGLRVLRGELGRVGLQDRADTEELGGLFLGGGVDEGALGGPQVDPAVGLEPLQRLAHGLAADPEVLGELGLDQVLAGLEGAADDQLGQGVVHGLPQRCRAGDAPGRGGRECLAHGCPVLPPAAGPTALPRGGRREGRRRLRQHTGFGMQDGGRLGEVIPGRPAVPPGPVNSRLRAAR